MKGIEALAPAIGKLASSISDGLWNLFKASWLILLCEPQSLVQLMKYPVFTHIARAF